MKQDTSILNLFRSNYVHFKEKKGCRTDFYWIFKIEKDEEREMYSFHTADTIMFVFLLPWGHGVQSSSGDSTPLLTQSDRQGYERKTS